MMKKIFNIVILTESKLNTLRVMDAEIAAAKVRREVKERLSRLREGIRRLNEENDELRQTNASLRATIRWLREERRRMKRRQEYLERKLKRKDTC